MDDIEIAEDNQATLRRTLTVRNNVARQMSVNFVPSKRPSYGSTIRHRRNNSDNNVLLDEAADATDADAADKRADIIVREMEHHQHLLEDNPEGEEKRKEALRDLAQGLTMKRHVRAKLSASVSLRSKRRPISMTKRLKYRISFAWKKFKDRCRDLLFSMELWYSSIRRIEGQFGSAVGSYFRFLRWIFLMDLVLAVLVLVTVVAPMGLKEGNGWGVQYLLSGKGAYRDSLLFYGYYHDQKLMPFLYFFSMTALYIGVFAILCYKTADSYRTNFIFTSDSVRSRFALRLFSSWDFGVVSRDAAALTSASIHNEFKELLSEQTKNQIIPSFFTKLLHRTTNTLVTLIILSAIVGLEYGLWRLLVLETATPYWDVLVSLVVTLVLSVLRGTFSAVVRLEYYSARTALYVTLARTWLLDVGTLTLLLYYWATHAKDKHLLLVADLSEPTDCWETSLGQEAYRLVLYDCLVSLFILPMFEFVRGSIYKMKQKGSAPEFNLAYNSLTLIYNQALLWFGLLFCPLLAVAVTIKLLLIFYVKQQCALRACRPARKIWRAAQTQTVLYMLITLSLFTTMFVIGSLFFSTKSTCGPFSGYSHVYEVLTEGALHLSYHPKLSSVIHFLTRPGVIAFLTLLLCVAVYYMRAKALAQGSMIVLLRDMRALQAKDKEFLLTAIAKVSNGEWLYSPRDEGAPDSHTWRLNEVRKPSNAAFHFDASRLSHSFAEGRPRSFAKENKNSMVVEDGDTDSSFSWQGSSNCLQKRGEGSEE